MQRPLLKPPDQLVNPDVLDVDSAHEAHVVFVLVKELLDHVLPHEHQDHPGSVLLQPLKLHGREPLGPSDSQLPRGKLLDSRCHLLSLVGSQGGPSFTQRIFQEARPPRSLRISILGMASMDQQKGKRRK